MMRLLVPWNSGLGEIDIEEYEGGIVTILDAPHPNRFRIVTAEPYEVVGEGAQIRLNLEPIQV